MYKYDKAIKATDNIMYVGWVSSYFVLLNLSGIKWHLMLVMIAIR